MMSQMATPAVDDDRGGGAFAGNELIVRSQSLVAAVSTMQMLYSNLKQHLPEMERACFDSAFGVASKRAYELSLSIMAAAAGRQQPTTAPTVPVWQSDWVNGCGGSGDGGGGSSGVETGGGCAGAGSGMNRASVGGVAAAWNNGVAGGEDEASMVDAAAVATAARRLCIGLRKVPDSVPGSGGGGGGGLAADSNNGGNSSGDASSGSQSSGVRSEAMGNGALHSPAASHLAGHYVSIAPRPQPTKRSSASFPMASHPLAATPAMTAAATAVKVVRWPLAVTPAPAPTPVPSPPRALLSDPGKPQQQPQPQPRKRGRPGHPTACPQCSTVFQTRSALRDHTVEIHPKRRRRNGSRVGGSGGNLSIAAAAAAACAAINVSDGGGGDGENGAANGDDDADSAGNDSDGDGDTGANGRGSAAATSTAPAVAVGADSRFAHGGTAAGTAPPTGNPSITGVSARVLPLPDLCMVMAQAKQPAADGVRQVQGSAEKGASISPPRPLQQVPQQLPLPPPPSSSSSSSGGSRCGCTRCSSSRRRTSSSRCRHHGCRRGCRPTRRCEELSSRCISSSRRWGQRRRWQWRGPGGRSGRRRPSLSDSFWCRGRRFLRPRRRRCGRYRRAPDAGAATPDGGCDARAEL
ncbi:unnamed protein product [Phaeothamnion confervicola]